MFFVGGTNREELRFETEDEATKEFNEIMKITEVIKQKFKKSKTIIARNSNLSL